MILTSFVATDRLNTRLLRIMDSPALRIKLIRKANKGDPKSIQYLKLIEELERNETKRIDAFVEEVKQEEERQFHSLRSKYIEKYPSLNI